MHVMVVGRNHGVMLAACTCGPLDIGRRVPGLQMTVDRASAPVAAGHRSHKAPQRVVLNLGGGPE